jgi:hypothetical protein
MACLMFERIEGGKIRVGTSSWDDPKVILPNQVLVVAVIGKQVGLVRVDKPIAYLDIDDTGLVEAGYGPESVTRYTATRSSVTPRSSVATASARSKYDCAFAASGFGPAGIF